MKRILIFTFFFVIGLKTFAASKDSVIHYQLPDSVKAIQFMTEINVGTFNAGKTFSTGIRTDVAVLSMSTNGKRKKFYFTGPERSEIKATGIGVKAHLRDGFEFYHDWAPGLKYKLMIAVASDSAENFSLYSGYVWLPELSKWKLIGTVKVIGQWTTIREPAFFYRPQKKVTVSVTATEVWCQRQNGSWKNMLQTDLKTPVVNLFSHVDSLEQLAIEKKLLEKLQSPNSPIKYKESGGVYFAIMKEGTGRLVSINDTVVVHYKGYLFDDNSVFDQTKDKPATFPLKRLIMGWQIALQFCQIGGKVQVIIPSNLAYSIRTRAAKIPPNSILVFEIEVVDAKSPQ